MAQSDITGPLHVTITDLLDWIGYLLDWILTFIIPMFLQYNRVNSPHHSVRHYWSSPCHYYRSI